mmetsp:Transcript_18129/g.43563  ORF Transcript_18129/g.43563 Transcript_18129/m.43563 type:complete len:861 (-) Transcript_18129:112-2694(-)
MDFDRLLEIGIKPEFPHGAIKWTRAFSSAAASGAGFKPADRKGGGGGGGKPAGQGDAKGKGGNDGSLEGKLANAEHGKVVTRFPPEPSGYLHIGHAKAAMLNHYYAKSFGGKLILRFDDTNPALEKQEFADSMTADLARLEIKPDRVTHTSDYFDYLQKLCEDLIIKGKFYVDDTPQAQMHEEREQGTENDRRRQSPEENVKLFKEMVAGSKKGQECCVRAKMDMQSKNKCLRDPVMYRCKVDAVHPRHGTKYKAYPTYDFACPVVDSHEGVTHALRTIEYKDREPQYQWVIEAAGLRPVNIQEFSKTQFSHTVLSKRKLTKFVEAGLVDGWDDPRFPTVQGVLRRGMTVEALLEFVTGIGASKNNNLMEWDKIWAINRQKIDPVTPRYPAVNKDGAVKFSLVNGPEKPEGKIDKKHQKNDDLGTRLIYLTKEVYLEQDDAALIEKGEEITLMHWGNAFVDEISKDAAGKVTALKGRIHPEGDVKKTKKKLHWVPVLDSQLTEFTMREFDHLITKAKIEDDDVLDDLINPQSQLDTLCIGDPLLKTLQKGDKLQLERRGFFIVDQVAISSRNQQLVLVAIPDGKSKGMSVVQAKIDPSKLQGGSKSLTPEQRAKLEKEVEEQGDKVRGLKANKAPKDEVDKAVAVLLELKKKLGGDSKKADSKEQAKAAPADSGKKEKKGAAKAAAAPEADRPLDDVSRLDIRVGVIKEVWEHPDSDKLWCEKIDLGEPELRNIGSGLRAHVSKEEMLGARVCVLANLKEKKLAGFPSHGMVLCASPTGDGVVELLRAPDGAKIGERVGFDGYGGEAEPTLTQKKNKDALAAVAPSLVVNDQCQATYKGVVFTTSAGPVTCKSNKGGKIS